MSFIAPLHPRPQAGSPRRPAPFRSPVLLAGWLAFGLAAGSAAGPVAAPLEAQSIRGQLLDDATEAPIVGATVSLLDARENAVRRVITDAAGWFSIADPLSGRYLLRAERIGYATVTSPPLDLVRGDTVVVELRTGVEAVPLAPLTVTESSRRLLRNRAMDGFYERQRRGWGHFIGPNEIERLRPWSATSVLHAAAGVRVHYGRTGGIGITMRGARGLPCGPTLFLDGSPLPFGDLDAWVPGTAVRAVEVYSRALYVPAEFATVMNPDCGVIVIWTSFLVPQ
jgi:hypothetical protein